MQVFIRNITKIMMALLFFNAMAYAKVEVLDKVVAVVNSDVITQTELNERMLLITAQLKNKNIPLPEAARLRQEVLNEMVIEKIELELAQQSGINISDRVVESAIHSIATNNKMTVAQLKQHLTKQGLTFAQFRDEIRKKLIINKLRQEKVASKINITDQQVTTFLESPEGKNYRSISYHLKHILVPIKKADSVQAVREAKQLANKLVHKIRAGESFSKIAVEYSKGEQALNGGDLGWKNADQLPRIYLQIAQELQKGKVSDPVRAVDGFHIIQLVDQKGQRKLQEQIHLQQLLLKSNPLRSEEKTQLLIQQLYKELKAGKNFNQLAKQYSDDNVSASNGGDLGWIPVESLDPTLQKQTTSLKTKQISEPFKYQGEWYIIQILGKRKEDISHQIKAEEVKQILGNRQLEDALQAWVKKIRSDAYVQILE